MKTLLLAISMAIVVASCQPNTPQLSSTWIDLTHPFDSTTLYWPNNKTGFVHTPDYVGFVRPMGYFYSSYSISAPEHGGWQRRSIADHCKCHGEELIVES